MEPKRQAIAVELVHVGVESIDLVGDLADCGLRGDAFIPRGQLRGILSRPTSRVLLILAAGEPCGFAIEYHGVTLHNLFLLPWARGAGIGAEVVRRLAPQVIRAKTNMKSGDPTPFYGKLGYKTVAADEKRPHITLMMPRGGGGTAAHAPEEGEFVTPPMFEEPPESQAEITAAATNSAAALSPADARELEYLRQKEAERKRKQADRARRRYHRDRQAEQSNMSDQKATTGQRISIASFLVDQQNTSRSRQEDGMQHVQRNGTSNV